MTAPTPADVFEDLDLAALRRRRSHKWTRYPLQVLPAFVAEMDFPVALPVRTALETALRDDDFGYAEPIGLAEAFVGFTGQRFGWEPPAERVLAVPDVMAGVAQTLRATTRPGDGVVINPPVYPPFFSTVRQAERTVVPVPLVCRDGRPAIDLDGLERAFAAGARAYLLCSPHNPTGTVVPQAKLRAVAELATAYDVTVISDEIHAALTLDGAAHVPYGSVSEAGVTLMSASKAFNIAGLKAAVLVPNSAAELERLALPEETKYGCGHLGVLTATVAFREGHSWLDALLTHLAGNRTLLAELLAEHLPTVRWVPQQAGYLAWLDCRELGLGDDPAATFLERGAVALSSGPTFGEREGAGHVRLNLGTSRALLTEVVKRMAWAVR